MTLPQLLALIAAYEIARAIVRIGAFELQRRRVNLAAGTARKEGVPWRAWWERVTE